MDKRSFLTNEGINQFSHALNILKTSIHELIEISENLIPEKILTHGVKEYLPELCKTIELEYKVIINLNFAGDFEKFDENANITIYKIFRTLINYLILDAKSSEITFLLSNNNNLFGLQEIDNGKDFNTAAFAYPGIKEFASMKGLVESIRGKFTISRKNDLNEINISMIL